MSRVKSMRRGALALAFSLSILAITAGQALAASGFPPYPK